MRSFLKYFFVLTALFLLITAGLFLFGDKLVLSQTVGLFNLRAGWEKELAYGTFYTIVDEDNKEIDRLGRYVYLDDEIITEDNRHYKIVKTDSKKRVATGKLMGEAELVWAGDTTVEVLAKNKGKVGIYMTHTDESYVPTDGAASIPGNGGILKVGNVFANFLKDLGIETEISFNKHDPHDANAYHRSRKTAVQLLKNNPIALVDVHRDGVPDPDFYKTEVSGKPGTKVRLVVGRQNPHMEANLAFAKNIKAYFDKVSPGLIKGIFMAKGNYNQDLGPRTILIEVGTYTNSRIAAQRGVGEFAEGVSRVVGSIAGPGEAPGVKKGLEGKAIVKSLIGLILLVVIGGALFLFLSTGSWQGAWHKLSQLDREFGFGKLREGDKGSDE